MGVTNEECRMKNGEAPRRGRRVLCRAERARMSTDDSLRETSLAPETKLHLTGLSK